MSDALIAEIEKLPPSEQIEIAHSIWERLSSDQAAVPVREEDLIEVRLSLAEHQADPDAAERWESVRREILST